jgi:hypothetical protein
MSREIRNEDFYSYRRTQAIERERERIRRERLRRDISWRLVALSAGLAVSLLTVAGGFWMAPKGGGYFAIALACWIAGGAYSLPCAGFLAVAIKDAVRFIRERS